MKTTKILMAAVLLAGCLASCSKDDDGGFTAPGIMPTFETLYSYLGRTGADAVAKEFEKAGFEVDVWNDEGHIGIDAEREVNENEYCWYEVSFGSDGKLRAIQYDGPVSNAESTVIGKIREQQQFCNKWPSHQWGENSNIYFYDEEMYAEFPASFEEMLSLLQDADFSTVFEIWSYCRCGGYVVDLQFEAREYGDHIRYSISVPESEY